MLYLLVQMDPMDLFAAFFGGGGGAGMGGMGGGQRRMHVNTGGMGGGACISDWRVCQYEQC